MTGKGKAKIYSTSHEGVENCMAQTKSRDFSHKYFGEGGIFSVQKIQFSEVQVETKTCFPTKNDEHQLFTGFFNFLKIFHNFIVETNDNVIVWIPAFVHR